MQAPFAKLIVRSPFVDEYDRYADLAGRCAAAGVTHLTFTEIERSLWEIDDPADPYLHWSVVHTSLFKIFPPALLQDWVPADYAARARESIARRAAILKDAGLKGAVFLYDPMYWPERVFQRHPELRGPRVDQPLICKNPRYAPCTDRPEVLEMYREGFKNLAELARGVLDVVIIRTNDSAAGFCWSRLYNGPNGPMHCRNIHIMDRASRFLAEARAGTSNAVEFYIQSARFTGGGAHERACFLNHLPEGCGDYIHGAGNTPGGRTVAGQPTDATLFPVRGLPNPAEILDKLSAAFAAGVQQPVLFTRPTMYGNNWEGESVITDFIAAFNRAPGAGPMAQVRLAAGVAERRYGAEAVEDAVAAWWRLHAAGKALARISPDLGVIFLGSLGQRRLTRPFVVFPERLTPTERADYEPFIFSVDKNPPRIDLLDDQTTRLVEDEEHLARYNKDFAEAVREYAAAGNSFHKAHACRPHADFQAAMTGLEILQCLLRNVQNCVNFQVRLDGLRQFLERESSRVPARATDHYRRSESTSLEELRQRRAELLGIMRDEMDNCRALADLLGRHSDAMIMASEPAGETPFMLGPGVEGALRRKADTMQRHMLELDEFAGWRRTAGLEA